MCGKLNRVTKIIATVKLINNEDIMSIIDKGLYQIIRLDYP